MTISAILFDADGVIQTTEKTFIPQLKSLVKEIDQTDHFLADIFAAEKPCLIGQRDFSAELEVVLKRWNVNTPLRQALAIWESIHPITEILDQIQSIRKGNILCYLATNQQSYRADYMRATLNYDSLFDGAFYSYEIGAVKPDELYFQKALAHLDISPADILFIDDKSANTEMAQACGMQALLFESPSFKKPAAALCDALNTLGIYWT